MNNKQVLKMSMVLFFLKDTQPDLYETTDLPEDDQQHGGVRHSSQTYKSLGWMITINI